MRIQYLVPAVFLVGVSACSASGPSSAPSPSPASTPSPTATADYRPISTMPATEKGLDFVELINVTTAGGVVTLHVDRKVMFVGDEALAHNRSDGNPPNDFAIEDPDGQDKELTFVLDPKAPLRSTENRALTQTQFVRNAGRQTAEGVETPLWLRHRDGLDGTITALAEQYLP